MRAALAAAAALCACQAFPAADEVVLLQRENRVQLDQKAQYASAYDPPAMPPQKSMSAHPTADGTGARAPTAERAANASEGLLVQSAVAAATGNARPQPTSPPQEQSLQLICNPLDGCKLHAGNTSTMSVPWQLVCENLESCHYRGVLALPKATPVPVQGQLPQLHQMLQHTPLPREGASATNDFWEVVQRLSKEVGVPAAGLHSFDDLREAHFIDDAGNLCLQGRAKYLQSVLDRRRRLAYGGGVLTAMVKDGPCSTEGYQAFEYKSVCFPQATFYLHDATLATRFNRSTSAKFAAQMSLICDV